MKILKDNIIIREANHADAFYLSEMQYAMAMETENLALDKEIVKKGLKALFDDPSKGKYYVLTEKDNIIGCVLNTFEWSEWRNAYILWIQSLYIVPEHRGKGLFKEMYLFFQELVKNSKELRGIRLYVDKSNQKAIETYKAIKMSNQHYEMFEWLE